MSTRRLLVLGAVATLILLAAPASATWMRVTDYRGDVQRVYVHAVFPGSGPVVVPSRANGDITATRVDHYAATITVTLRLRELYRNGEIDTYAFRFKTGDRERDVFFSAYPGAHPPIDRTTYWAGTPARMSTPAGRRVSCAMSRRIDYAANTVRLVVARGCLGNPPWVRVGARVTTRPGSDPVYFDDAFSGAAFSQPTRLGPRVPR